jgi:hypothetical protein
VRLQTFNPGLRTPVLFGAAVLLMASTLKADTTYGFQTINDSADPTFNQLLGINNSGTIAGYFGSGSATNPNKGYTIAPPYSQDSYTNENFPGSVQTQVTGLNNGNSPTTVGFWVDNAANNFGFVKQGNAFTRVNAPATTTFNQLLGVNDSNVAVGFYQDAGGAFHGYTYNIANNTFSTIAPGNSSSTRATGINNNGSISGFYSDASGAQHGFIDNNGNFVTLDDPNGTNTALFGINDNGQAVGTFMDANGITNGTIYNSATNSWQTLDDPSQSSTAAFNFAGTALNGINDRGQVVGFYSDGTNVDGFLATPTPEPASMALAGVGAALIFLGRRKICKTKTTETDPEA